MPRIPAESLYALAQEKPMRAMAEFGGRTEGEGVAKQVGIAQQRELALSLPRIRCVGSPHGVILARARLVRNRLDTKRSVVLPEDVNYLKGVAFTGMLETFTRVRGDEVAAQVVARLNPDFRSLVEHGLVIKSSWLPVSWYRELLDSMIAQSPGDGVQLIRQTATEVVVYDLSKGVYRLMMKVLSPKWLIQNTPKLFRNYYKVGDCKVSLSGEHGGSGTIHFSACRGFSAAMWEDLIGGSIGVLIAAGAKEPQEVGRRGGRANHDFMDVELEWDN